MNEELKPYQSMHGTIYWLTDAEAEKRRKVGHDFDTLLHLSLLSGGILFIFGLSEFLIYWVIVVMLAMAVFFIATISDS